MRPLASKHLLGFTLVELLVVIALAGALLSLMMPAIQSAREAARRSSCQNNLRQIGSALLNYESAHQTFPVGVQRNVTFGNSWLVAIAAALDESAIMGQLDTHGPHSGSVFLNATNGSVVDGVRIDTLICPSSPLPPMKQVTAFQLTMPSYVGISGAVGDVEFSETRVSTCCVPELGGKISAGGVLIPNQAVSIRQIVDGTSKTLIVGEASDYARGADGTAYRIDGGNPLGWIAGTTARGTPPDYNSGFSPPSWNVTTVRYPPNTRNYELPGIDDNRGANNPLLSAHPVGVCGLFADGSVHFLADALNTLHFKRLSTRDDSHSLPLGAVR
jgi:prepilin-type N-terminal cleavage/methylation domain-containing protein